MANQQYKSQESQAKSRKSRETSQEWQVKNDKLNANSYKSIDLVFSVKLLLPLTTYPLSIDHWLLTLDPWFLTSLDPWTLNIERWPLSLIPYPLCLIPHPLSLIYIPCSLSLNPMYGSFQENLVVNSLFFIHWRVSSVEGRLPSKEVFHWR